MQLEETNIQLLVTLTTLFSLVSADLEYSCTESQHNNPFSKFCVFNLVDFVVSSCIPSYDDSIVDPEIPSEIFIDSDEANSLLNYPLGSYQSGLPCECCVHRCTATELEQYCAPMQKAYPSRRRRRSVQTKQSKHFRSEDIEEVYNSINVTANQSPVTPAVSQISIEKFEQISKIKAWKLENIENKLLARFGVGANSGRSVNKASPQSKVDQASARAFKPKLFTQSVNKHAKHAQPSPHHHRHKYLGRRDGVNIQQL